MIVTGPVRTYYYWPRDGIMPEFGATITVHHPHFGTAGITGEVVGIHEGGKLSPCIWLLEPEGDTHKYDLFSVSWENL